jgi:hypothetical protein
VSNKSRISESHDTLREEGRGREGEKTTESIKVGDQRGGRNIGLQSVKEDIGAERRYHPAYPSPRSE